MRVQRGRSLASATAVISRSTARGPRGLRPPARRRRRLARRREPHWRRTATVRRRPRRAEGDPAAGRARQRPQRRRSGGESGTRAAGFDPRGRTRSRWRSGQRVPRRVQSDARVVADALRHVRVRRLRTWVLVSGRGGIGLRVPCLTGEGGRASAEVLHAAAALSKLYVDRQLTCAYRSSL